MELAHMRTFWDNGAVRPRRPALDRDIEVDVAVIGAGVTGLTTASMLKRRGLRVAVIEALRVGSGTSGATTAHLTSSYDHRYTKIENLYGVEVTRLLALALNEGIDLTQSLIAERGIDCDFKRIPGYFYAEAEQGGAFVREEFGAARRAGLTVEMTNAVPLPFRTSSGVLFAEQAELHPLRYLLGLAQAIEDDGTSKIYEHTRVLDFEDGSPCRVLTEHGTVTCREIVMATHTPIGLNALQTALEPRRSFVLAVATPDHPREALFWDTSDPYYYIRRSDSVYGPLVIIGGRDGKTGTSDERAAFAALESYIRERFDIDRIVARWAAQLYEPADHLPLIGKSPLASHVHVATGFSGDGMTLGALAGSMLARHIQGEVTPYDKLFRPARLRVGGIKGFVQDQLHVARHFIGDRFPSLQGSKVASLAAGEGCVDTFGGAKIAAYRTQSGELRTFSALCTHMRCVVRWNAREATFDCPCHGARFDAAGQPLEGPALEALGELEVDLDSERIVPAAPGAPQQDERQATGNDDEATL